MNNPPSLLFINMPAICMYKVKVTFIVHAAYLVMGTEMFNL
jgi:hypothetical protein